MLGCHLWMYARLGIAAVTQKERGRLYVSELEKKGTVRSNKYQLFRVNSEQFAEAEGAAWLYRGWQGESTFEHLTIILQMTDTTRTTLMSLKNLTFTRTIQKKR